MLRLSQVNESFSPGFLLRRRRPCPIPKRTDHRRISSHSPMQSSISRVGRWILQWYPSDSSRTIRRNSRETSCTHAGSSNTFPLRASLSIAGSIDSESSFLFLDSYRLSSATCILRTHALRTRAVHWYSSWSWSCWLEIYRLAIACASTRLS